MSSSVFSNILWHNQNHEEEEKREEKATRNNHDVVNVQQREGALPAGKPKVTKCPGDAKKRKALEDIGNLVNTRRIKRSFGAQLPANAQAAGAANKNVLKQAALPANGAAKKKPASKNTKPITDPKVACGIVDIDAADTGNELSVVKYVEGLYKFYKDQEKMCSPRDYMSSQVEINAKMRAILVDWLIEVHLKFEMMPETLYSTMFIIDRFLSMESVQKKELQLLGVSAMLVASKFEKIRCPMVKDLICITNEAYNKEQILRMEEEILKKLDWKLTFPTSYVFIVRFLKAAVADKEMEHMTFFYAELALLHYSIAMHCPSLIAASAVYAARCTLKKSPLWSKTLEYHTGYLEENLLECAKKMAGYHSSAANSRLNELLYRKYSDEVFGAVALKSPDTIHFYSVFHLSSN